MGLKARGEPEGEADRNPENISDGRRRDAIQRRNTEASHHPDISRAKGRYFDRVAGSKGHDSIDAKDRKFQNMADASKMMEAALVLLGNGGCILSAAKLADAVEYLNVSILQQAASGRMRR